MLELCTQNDCPYDEYVRVCAVQEDKAKTLNILKWLHGKNFDEYICDFLADYGNVEALKWTREIGYEWDIDTFERAVQNGDKGILQFCLDNGCPHGPSLYEKAFGENTKEEQTLNVCKWLHHHGIPWDECASNTAACDGHTSTLKWLLDHGCPCSEEILKESIQNVPVEMCMIECYLANVEHIERDIYTYVIQTMEDAMYSDTAEATIIQIFQIFRDCDIDWDEGLIATAERLDKANVARWLKCNGCPS